MITDQQVEDIVLLYRLTGISYVDAAYAVIPDFDKASIYNTWGLTSRIIEAEKRLDNEFNAAHS